MSGEINSSERDVTRSLNRPETHEKHSWAIWVLTQLTGFVTGVFCPSWGNSGVFESQITRIWRTGAEGESSLKHEDTKEHEEHERVAVGCRRLAFSRNR